MRTLSDLMRNFLQIGYVTDDIDAATSYLESTFGTIECVKHFTSSLGRGNPGAASEVVAASGMTWKQFGRSGDVRFGYLDATATLGHFIEVMELGPDGAGMFAQLEAASNAARP
jgi:hypothetical protein